VAEDNGPLLRAAAAGDQAAWDVVVARYTGLLWSIACSFRLGTADAADATQNTWLRLVENLSRVQEPERVGSWLATTMRRECLQLLRRTSRERPAPTDDWLTDLPAGTQPLDTALLLNERDAALWRALGSLSESCQQLLRVLMATPPPSYQEVADALGLARGSIGPLRQRCLNRLRKIVDKDDVLGERARLGDLP
jgi:RNA polymerase sigma factor (sigma-70 family)